MIPGLDADRVTIPPEGMSRYSWRGLCRVSACGRPATASRALWGSGFARWIVVDGQPWANVAGLCERHRLRLENGTSRVCWEDHADPVGWWYRSPERYAPFLPLGCAEGVVAAGGRHCPHCGRTTPRPQPFDNRRRRTATTGLRVPVDQGEDGRLVIDSLLQEAAAKMGFDLPEGVSLSGGGTAAYHVVTTALAAVVADDGVLRSLVDHANGNGHV